MRTRARTVTLLLFDEVELLDFAGAVQVLSVAGRHYNFRAFKIQTVAPAAGPIDTRNQLRVHADCSLDECNETDVLLVPGGYGARRLLEDELLIEWLGRRGRTAELIVTLGYGCLLLAKAGLYDEQRAAVPRDVEALFRELAPSAELADEEIAVSGKLLSARSTGSSTELGLYAVQRLLGDKFATQVALRLGARWPASPTELLRIDWAGSRE
jgi:transcriptional regulator GlxA family with amidase domain